MVLIIPFGNQSQSVGDLVWRL